MRGCRSRRRWGRLASCRASRSTLEAIADATFGCFLRTVPAAVAGIAFLSSGQPAELASARLNAMNLWFRGRTPWDVTFSFARAIQQSALELWRGQLSNVALAQKALFEPADCNRVARRGRYDAAIDAPAVV
jgi:fructose-bisphosphate aldolase, class I